MSGVLRMAMLGRQGSGKGTQSLRVCEAFGCVHLSTGDMLRAAVASGSELGRQAEKLMSAGELVGDDVVNGIVAERIAADDISANGVLFDGFPRTAEQAEALSRMLAGLGQTLTLAVNIDVDVAEVTQRMLTRGRVDDTPEAIARRLDLYDAQTAPLLDWFADHDLLVTVEGTGSEAEIFERLRTVIESRLK